MGDVRPEGLVDWEKLEKCTNFGGLGDMTANAVGETGRNGRRMGEQNKWYNVWVLGIREVLPQGIWLKWSGGEGVRRSRNREPRAWGGLTTEATASPRP